MFSTYYESNDLFLVYLLKPLEPYPIHAKEVMVYWIPLLEGLAHKNGHLSLLV
jgi:hypothetical protein